MLTRNLFRRPRNKLEDAGANSMARPEIPGQLYASCPNCRAMNPAEELTRHADVCPKCQHHFRVSARRRIALTADEGTFSELWPTLVGVNPIAFPDYDKKLVSAKEQSNEVEAVVVGECAIGGVAACVFAMEPSFMMGSMGTAVGEKIARLFEHALEKSLPVVGFCVSGGARMQEGILSLMQMAKTTGAVKRHSDAGNLYIAILTDPTTGGVTASFAMEGDITISEPGALIGFAGPRVIEQTIRQKLAEGFQRAEFVLEKGFVDMICDRRDLVDRIAGLLKLHRREVAE
ncbi:MAG: acetyl-CoA carboxylase carboxyltransferase subunit beta [Clostridiales bacterium]|nr:acetyl-CoA carboxylase carboxyltransferase subunit beta [Clostridiales bacterium]